MPVMVHEVAEALVVNPSGLYLDATAGGGGHTAAILDRLDGRGRVVALDRDQQAREALHTRFEHEPRVSIIAGNFRDIGRLKEIARRASYFGVLFDFGVSSHQIDDPDRGFSFQVDGPLDMRMDRSLERSAAQVVNESTLDDLTTVLREYGELSSPRKIARRIIEARPLWTTAALAAAVAPGSRRDVKLLAQVFQAIRIEVNGELAAIEEGLEAAVELLAPGGRLVTLAYHSLEDRRVKRLLRRESGEAVEQRGIPVELRAASPVRMRAVFRKAMKASNNEVALNPRARSVRMRVAERLA